MAVVAAAVLADDTTTGRPRTQCHVAYGCLRLDQAAEAADIDPDRISYSRALRIIRRNATGTAAVPPEDWADALPDALADNHPLPCADAGALSDMNRWHSVC